MNYLRKSILIFFKEKKEKKKTHSRKIQNNEH